MNPARITLTLFSALILFSCNNSEQTKNEPGGSINPVSVVQDKPVNGADSTLADSVREQLIEKYAAANQYDRALEQIEYLLKKNAINPAWLFMKADALEKKGDTSAAIDNYKKAIESAGMFIDAEMKLANLFAETGNESALAICDALLKKPAGLRMRSDILLIKGIYYTRIQKPQQAIAIFDQIIKEDYSCLDAYIEKGLIYYDQKKYKEALKVFELTTTVKNSFADGYYWMAKAQEKMEQKEESINNYKRTLALDQSFTEAREGLKRLGALN